MQKNVLILGANGMIGSIILQKCIASQEIHQIIAITRKKLNIQNDKLVNILHQDFLNVDSIEHYFENIDICYYCLGVYTGAVSNELFYQITVDYTKVIANKLIQKSPKVSFHFLSGMGADLSEKSKLPFARAKGIAENYLLNKGFSQLVIFRPGYIYPTTKRKEPNLMYTISRWIYPLLRWIYPNIGLSSEDLATAMFIAAFKETPGIIMENKAIRNFIAS